MILRQVSDDYKLQLQPKIGLPCNKDYASFAFCLLSCWIDHPCVSPRLLFVFNLRYNSGFLRLVSYCTCVRHVCCCLLLSIWPLRF